jgi:hypothetical protein
MSAQLRFKIIRLKPVKPPRAQAGGSGKCSGFAHPVRSHLAGASQKDFASLCNITDILGVLFSSSRF